MWAGGIPHMRKVEVHVLLHVFILTPAYSHGSLRQEIRLTRWLRAHAWISLAQPIIPVAIGNPQMFHSRNVLL